MSIFAQRAVARALVLLMYKALYLYVGSNFCCLLVGGTIASYIPRSVKLIMTFIAHVG
jgi:hypothetical protein